MHSTPCTVCQIKADTTKQNTKKCFSLTIRPDFARNRAAAVRGSFAADAELRGQRGDGGSGERGFGEGTCSCQNAFSF